MYVDITSVSHAYVHMFDARNRIASWLKRAALPHRQHTPCRQSPAPCEDCSFFDSFDTSGVGYQEVMGVAVAVSLAANGMGPIQVCARVAFITGARFPSSIKSPPLPPLSLSSACYAACNNTHRVPRRRTPAKGRSPSPQAPSTAHHRRITSPLSQQRGGACGICAAMRRRPRRRSGRPTSSGQGRSTWPRESTRR